MQSFCKRIGIIDTGSNTIRLAVFDTHSTLRVPKIALRNGQHSSNGSSDPLSLSHKSKVEFEEVVDIKNTAGLSNYVKDGVFSDAGVDKATRVLREHITCAENLNCDVTYIFATAVLRNAKNSKKVVSAIEGRIGAKIELLSGEEEAKLGLEGAFYGSDVTRGLLIDLGGGSCEITEFDVDECNTASLKMGCVSAYSQFVSSIFPTKKECEKIMVATNDKLENATFKLAKEENVFGIGGSVRAVAKFTREMKNLAKTPKHVRAQDVQDMLDFLMEDKDAFAHVAVRSIPDRIHSVVPGCIIIGQFLKATGARQLDICRKGLREGYLLNKLAKNAI